jgi:hypothetical protein
MKILTVISLLITLFTWHVQQHLEKFLVKCATFVEVTAVHIAGSAIHTVLQAFNDKKGYRIVLRDK